MKTENDYETNYIYASCFTVLTEKLIIVHWSRNSSTFIKSKASLSYSQESATSPVLEIFYSHIDLILFL
jgi:hypothetical protein